MVSTITVFAGVLLVHQSGANHAPGESVTQVNHSIQILSTFIIIIIIIIIIIMTIPSPLSLQFSIYAAGN